MIFTGFTDVNGNVIPVQGAGTVYDEEKNSLALGKDTVAIGQDQLVFGRKNVQDANKVEIVGGNRYAIGQNVGTGLWYGGNSYDEFKQCISNVTGVPVANISIPRITELDNGITYTQEEIDMEIDEQELECFLLQWFNNRLTWSVHWKNHGWPSTGYMQVNGYTNVPDIEQISPTATITVGRANSFSVNTSTWSGDTILNNMKHFNIRTLAWDGTQWNAGDITCDDGNGNTISMRDLLSRIATLEAAAANS